MAKIASLDARKASDEAFEFEYVNPAGDPTGLFFSVLGSQSDRVTAETNKLINQRRHKEAIAAAQKARKNEAAYTPVEDDILFSQRLAAVRLVGWRGPEDKNGLEPDQLQRLKASKGIEDPFTPDLALQLCQSNAHIASEVLEASNEMANFTKASPTT